MNRQLKNAALRSLRYAGVFRLLGNSLRRKKRLLILCYHGVSMRDEHVWRPALYMSAATFRRRLEILRDFRANVLNLTDALARLRSGTLPERSVVLTFDDGFVDFRFRALPLLQEFGYPSTVYLTTFYCDRDMPVFNLVTSYTLACSGAKEIDISDFGGPDEPVRIALPEEQNNVVRTLVLWAQNQQLAVHDKGSISRVIACRLGVDYQALLSSRILQIMSSGDVDAVSRAGVEIELHTHRHRTPRPRSFRS